MTPLFNILGALNPEGQPLPHHAALTVLAGDLRAALGINNDCPTCFGRGYTCNEPLPPLALEDPLPCRICFSEANAKFWRTLGVRHLPVYRIDEVDNKPLTLRFAEPEGAALTIDDQGNEKK